MDSASASARSLAATAVRRVVGDGRSLSEVLPPLLLQADRVDRALVQEFAYGVLRWRFRLEQLMRQLVARPLKARDQDVYDLLLIGLYQLAHTSIPEHAAVHETVEAVRATGKRWAVPLANAVLRGYLRRRAELERAADADARARYAHPGWLIDALRLDWPDAWASILEANNARPPFVLRVNARRGSRSDYLQTLTEAGLYAVPLPYAPDALWLPQPAPVDRLPGFSAGLVSVQDGAAQLAAPLLGVLPGMRVLDACAAPGGKTAHILERTPDCDLVALDLDPARARRIEENLQRLGLSARVQIGDAAAPAEWWDGEPFDRILLDAPCSATGVIRRHPDIKSLRRAGDIDELVATQARLLDALWPLLAPGGMLLYATCSVLRRENDQQIGGFLQRRADAVEGELADTFGRSARHGRQIFPGDGGGPAAADPGMDGFYFASLIKRREGG